MLSRFTTFSFRTARPQPPALLQNANVNLLAKMPMSISSPKCQGQSPRQTTNVNLLAKIPMSISSSKSHCRSPRQDVNVNLLVKMPMSISSPKSQCPPPRQTAHVSSFAKCTTHEFLTVAAATVLFQTKQKLNQIGQIRKYIFMQKLFY
jgi:hypothetical protein